MSPTQPQKDAGWRIEPPVSVASDASAMPPATAAAEPPLEPPGTRSSATGLRVFWNALCSVEVPMANSSMFTRPVGTAPAVLIRAMTVASYGAT